MELDALNAFITVAKTGSFSKAAQRLFITQPAVSKRIATLEHQLDIKLFDRLGKKITMTEAGRVLLPKAEKILADLNEARQLLANLSGEVRGSLRLGTSHHIGLHRLPPVLQQFSERYPEVDLDISFMDSEDACLAVEQGRLELAIITLPIHVHPRLQTLPIWQDPLVFVASPRHPLTRLSPLDFPTLSRYGAILPAGNTVTRQIIENQLAQQSLKLTIKMESNYLETICKMVEIGLGWSALPRVMVHEGISILHLPEINLNRVLGVVHHKNRSTSNAARALIDLLGMAQQ
ncbi:MAG TPA: LysR family transcriptional regulator [Gammaproteobacteria bacterium]|nr:LysR family transcriptional regulator [Gammaproteobacteria bacterium]